MCLVRKIKSLINMVERWKNKNNRSMNMNSNHITSKSKQNYYHYYWNRFINLNNEIATFFEEIKVYNQFWSKYVTIYFIVYVIMTGYLAMGMLNSGKNRFKYKDTKIDEDEELLFSSIANRSFFILFTPFLVGVLYAVTYECSWIVHNSELIWMK